MEKLCVGKVSADKLFKASFPTPHGGKIWKAVVVNHPPRMEEAAIIMSRKAITRAMHTNFQHTMLRKVIELVTCHRWTWMGTKGLCQKEWSCDISTREGACMTYCCVDGCVGQSKIGLHKCQTCGKAVHMICLYEKGLGPDDDNEIFCSRRFCHYSWAIERSLCRRIWESVDQTRPKHIGLSKPEVVLLRMAVGRRPGAKRLTEVGAYGNLEL